MTARPVLKSYFVVSTSFSHLHFLLTQRFHACSRSKLPLIFNKLVLVQALPNSWSSSQSGEAKRQPTGGMNIRLSDPSASYRLKGTRLKEKPLIGESRQSPRVLSQNEPKGSRTGMSADCSEPEPRFCFQGHYKGVRLI